MLAKYSNKRNVIEFVGLEAMVPEDHFLRKIDAAMNLKKLAIWKWKDTQRITAAAI